MLVDKSNIKAGIQAEKEEMIALPLVSGMKRVVFLAKVSARKYYVGARYENESISIGDESTYDHGTAFYGKCEIMAVC